MKHLEMFYSIFAKKGKPILMKHLAMFYSIFTKKRITNTNETS